jgi:hypothetical protein
MKGYAMNKEELNWLLETIKDTETAERFVLAQYEHGRISPEVMADVAWNAPGSTEIRINS